MNKAIVILTFLAVTIYAIPAASWAHQHRLGPTVGEGETFTPTQPNGFIGPLLSGEGLSQSAEQSAWDGIKLMHPDPHHLRSSEFQHRAFYRDNHTPDGAALMFSWPFGSLGSQTTPGNTKLTKEQSGIGSYEK